MLNWQKNGTVKRWCQCPTIHGCSSREDNAWFRSRRWSWFWQWPTLTGMLDKNKALFALAFCVLRFRGGYKVFVGSAVDILGRCYGQTLCPEVVVEAGVGDSRNAGPAAYIVRLRIVWAATEINSIAGFAWQRRAGRHRRSHAKSRNQLNQRTSRSITRD